MSKIVISGLNKADVLAVLFNAAKPQGMGFMKYQRQPMSRAEAEGLLKVADYFDYLEGRVMKLDMSRDEIDTWGYDRDNGAGAAERAIASLQQSGEVNPLEVHQAHKVNTLQSALNERQQLAEPETQSGEIIPGFTGVSLGLSDMAEHLRPILDEVINEEDGD